MSDSNDSSQDTTQARLELIDTTISILIKTLDKLVDRIKSLEDKLNKITNDGK